MWQRMPGRGRYAQPEFERRYLLAHLPPGVDSPKEIFDRYIEGTRLRLRRVMGTGESVHKLGQKVRTDINNPAEVMMTNIYLDSDEYGRLLGLPAAVLRKTRYSLEFGARSLTVDAFHDELDGLVLAEKSLAEPDGRAPAELRGFIAEVSTDDRFTGGTLSRTTAADLRDLLAGFGPP